MLALIPILAPSLLPAISLIYLFGNQGFLKGLLFGGSIYGAVGIVVAQVFYCLPACADHRVAALSIADARLYEAATRSARRSPAFSSPSPCLAPSTA